jgi:hypothetical protein
MRGLTKAIAQRGNHLPGTGPSMAPPPLSNRCCNLRRHLLAAAKYTPPATSSLAPPARPTQPRPQNRTTRSGAAPTDERAKAALAGIGAEVWALAYSTLGNDTTGYAPNLNGSAVFLL